MCLICYFDECRVDEPRFMHDSNGQKRECPYGPPVPSTPRDPLAGENLLSFAVCIVVHDKAGNLLIVARKNRHDDWNLPGGKVEENETLEAAAQRELSEETGIYAVNFRRVFVRVDRNTVCVTYLAEAVTGMLKPNDGEAPVRWGRWTDILSDHSTFSDYNRTLHRILKKQGLVT